MDGNRVDIPDFRGDLDPCYDVSVVSYVAKYNCSNKDDDHNAPTTVCG